MIKKVSRSVVREDRVVDTAISGEGACTFHQIGGIAPGMFLVSNIKLRRKFKCHTFLIKYLLIRM